MNIKETKKKRINPSDSFLYSTPFKIVMCETYSFRRYPLIKGILLYAVFTHTRPKPQFRDNQPYFIIGGKAVEKKEGSDGNDVTVPYSDPATMPPCPDCNAVIHWMTEHMACDMIQDTPRHGLTCHEYAILDIGHCTECGSLYLDDGAVDRGYRIRNDAISRQ